MGPAYGDPFPGAWLPGSLCIPPAAWVKCKGMKYLGLPSKPSQHLHVQGGQDSVFINSCWLQECLTWFPVINISLKKKTSEKCQFKLSTAPSSIAPHSCGQWSLCLALAGGQGHPHGPPPHPPCKEWPCHLGAAPGWQGQNCGWQLGVCVCRVWRRGMFTKGQLQSRPREEVSVPCPHPSCGEGAFSSGRNLVWISLLRATAVLLSALWWGGTG